ncbi:DnaJ domain-containing protein [Iningainema tapete]|uniref:DnaJ domain-containing protein n=1 Tax=Iningainema tapete TaxID=2806730 RepID=UPI0030807042
MEFTPEKTTTNPPGSSPVAFSPHGKTLVSGGKGGTIKIWHKIQGINKSTLEPILSGEWWEVLGVEKDDYPNNIKLAYRRLARHYHPDFNNPENPTAHDVQKIAAAFGEHKVATKNSAPD